MRLIRDEERVLLDAGPFFRFCDAGQLRPFAQYLGSRAAITSDVAAEIELRASSPKPHLRTHPGLQNLHRLRFPGGSPIQLEGQQLAEVERIRSQWAGADEHPKAHRGEISTVIAARELGHQIAVIDDVQGIKLAELNRLEVIKTTHLVAEMVVAGALSEADGWPIFRAVRHDSANHYQAFLANFRNAMCASR